MLDADDAFEERDCLYAEPCVSIARTVARCRDLLSKPDSTADELREAGIELLSLNAGHQVIVVQLLTQAVAVESSSENQSWLELALTAC